MHPWEHIAYVHVSSRCTTSSHLSPRVQDSRNMLPWMHTRIAPLRMLRICQLTLRLSPDTGDSGAGHDQVKLPLLDDHQSQDKISSARSLFAFVIPLLSAERDSIRSAIVTLRLSPDTGDSGAGHDQVKLPLLDDDLSCHVFPKGRSYVHVSSRCTTSSHLSPRVQDSRNMLPWMHTRTPTLVTVVQAMTK
jgi:hypothetical protein